MVAEGTAGRAVRDDGHFSTHRRDNESLLNEVFLYLEYRYLSIKMAAIKAASKTQYQKENSAS